MTGKMQVEEVCTKVRLIMEDATGQVKWYDGADKIGSRLALIRLPRLAGGVGEIKTMVAMSPESA